MPTWVAMVSRQFFFFLTLLVLCAGLIHTLSHARAHATSPDLPCAFTDLPCAFTQQTHSAVGNIQRGQHEVQHTAHRSMTMVQDDARWRVTHSDPLLHANALATDKSLFFCFPFFTTPALLQQNTGWRARQATPPSTTAHDTGDTCSRSTMPDTSERRTTHDMNECRAVHNPSKRSTVHDTSEHRTTHDTSKHRAAH